MTWLHKDAKLLCMEDFSQKIAQRIRAARKAKGKTQSEIARVTGLDQSYISRLENSTAEGSPSQLMAIARAIGVPIAQIYDDQDERAARLSELSDEAIEVARAWMGLPEGERRAIKTTIELLKAKENNQ